MKRTYTDRDMIRILNQELVIPGKVDQGMQDAYRKLGIKRKGTVSFARKRRMWHILAAAAVLAAGSSVAVVAANKFLSANLVKQEDSVAYKLVIDRDQAAHEIEVTPTYMPAGYELGADNTPIGGKCHNEETGGTISFRTMNAAELDSLIRLGETDDLTSGMTEKDLEEEIEINGTKAALFLLGKDYVDSENERMDVMLFNEEDGYLVQLFNSSALSKSEILKIAKGLDIKVLDSTVPYKTEEEIQTLLAQKKDSDEQFQNMLAPEILADNNFFSVGTELEIPYKVDKYGTKLDDYRFTVNSIEIKDSLPLSEFAKENYYDHDGELAAWLNEDGTLKAHERYKYTYDSNGNQAGEPTVDTVDSKFVVVDMKLKNNNEVNQFGDEVMVCPFVKYLDTDGDTITRSYTADFQYRGANEDYHLQTDGFPIYFDKISNTEGIDRMKGFHIVSLQPGEELEYTLVYVVDEDRLDDAYLQFYSGEGHECESETGNEYVYVKIEQ